MVQEEERHDSEQHPLVQTGLLAVKVVQLTLTDEEFKILDTFVRFQDTSPQELACRVVRRLLNQASEELADNCLMWP